ncbi:MAG: aminodeoxychorismate/anthranilate synthase component II [Pseudomonadota bacterium]
MLLMIDNYDSFTFNLVHYFKILGVKINVQRNDCISLHSITAMQPHAIIISPGPGTPDQAGLTLDIIKTFAGKIPLLGVCLGHQAIAQAFGANIVRAKKIMHGKTSEIFHNNKNLFRSIPNPCIATRYHSLVIEKNTLPKSFTITAWTRDNVGSFDEIMGIVNYNLAIFGIQFHPESILTTHGLKLLRNFLDYANQYLTRKTLSAE